MLSKMILEAVRETVTVPAHVAACASAVRYDLMHGPAWARVPSAGIEAFTADHFATYAEDLEDVEGELVQVWDSAISDTLRAFIDGLPTLYAGEDGYVSEYEPQGEWLEGEDGEEDEWIEPEVYAELDRRTIVHALFGDTIAKEL